MDIKSLHHVAYRCKDAKQTADFYTRVLGLEYAMAVAEDRVPSTGEAHPYMHIFFRMDDGNYVAFFELPESPEMGRDANTPLWVQHLALKVADEETLLRNKSRIESHASRCSARSTTASASRSTSSIRMAIAWSSPWTP
jgi:glyoxylase I family protein